jgi:DNA-binding transcriptional MerR regulator
MFKIGEFSRLGRVTVDTLRHYDTLGLVRPAKVDPFTGYRYYTAKQLLVLQRIAALKELGFSLDEIARILQEQLTTDQLRGMLKMQLVAAERDLQITQSRLDRIQARLTYLNLEDDMPDYEVTLKPVAAQTVATIREVVPTLEQMPERCSAMFDTIAEWMVQNRLPFGPSLSIYYGDSFTGENIDTECAFVVPDAQAAQAALPTGEIIVRRLEPLPLAATTIVTDEEGAFYKQPGGLTPAYNALAQWIEANGYQITGEPRELFHGSVKHGDLTAEIQFPVAKV